MKTGVVKWFNNAKGYGFILSDEENQDVFAHYSSIDMDGYRTLRAGQCVAFEAIDGPKGLHAMAIRVLEEVTLTGVPAPAGDNAAHEAVHEQGDASAPVEPTQAQATATQPADSESTA